MLMTINIGIAITSKNKELPSQYKAFDFCPYKYQVSKFHPSSSTMPWNSNISRYLW